MNDVLALVGQITLIACVQAVFNALIDETSKPVFSKVLNVACYAGALLFLLQFLTVSLIPEIFSLFRLSFHV